MPMRPIQNAIAIIATFFAAGALLPWDNRLRIVSALAAGGLIMFLLVLRLQAHGQALKRSSDGGLDDKIARIRAARARRMGRGP